jgi:serine/threonine protein kinase
MIPLTPVEEGRVALKIQDPSRPRQAMNEIALHRALNGRHGRLHPGIIRLIEAFVFRGCITMTFERHGCGLDKILRAGPMELGTIKTITVQLIHALRLLHSAGYTHSDVKPGNILYDPATKSVKLIDLGGAASQLRQGSRLGTRCYRAPEVVLGAPLGRAIDVWAVGCTVWGMLTGQRLFDPEAAAGRKYKEFSQERDQEASPTDGKGASDPLEEGGPQVGELWGGKYLLEQAIGSGGYGSVWSAAVVGKSCLDQSHRHRRGEWLRQNHVAQTAAGALPARAR